MARSTDGDRRTRSKRVLRLWLAAHPEADLIVLEAMQAAALKEKPRHDIAAIEGDG